MDLPLEIRHGDDVLELEAAEHSSTRLDLFLTLDAFGPRLMELHVADVQDLAGALLEWLVANGHELPELPAMDLEYEDEDEPEDSRPPGTFGQLVVRREQDRVLIDQADPWVLASGELLEQLLTPATPWCTVNGLQLSFQDDAGRTCRYVVRPDVSSPSGTAVLQQTAALQHYAAALPEWEDKRPHSRACGIRNHSHGPECHSNCPTCEGRSAQDQVHRLLVRDGGGH